MKYKEEYELATMNELLLIEDDNEDRLYFIRIYAVSRNDMIRE